PDERALYDQQAAQIERPALVRAIRAFNEAVNSYRGGWQPQLSLELALMESLLREAEPVAAQPAAVSAQQSAPKPAAESVDLVQPKRDSEPVVPAAAVNEQWDRVLGAMYKYSKTSPDVMRYFRAQRVEGNVIYLC